MDGMGDMDEMLRRLLDEDQELRRACNDDPTVVASGRDLDTAKANLEEGVLGLQGQAVTGETLANLTQLMANFVAASNAYSMTVTDYNMRTRLTGILEVLRNLPRFGR